jgi:glutathione peroxidase
LTSAVAAAGLAPRGNPATAADAKDAWQFTFTSREGHPMPFSRWRGKVLLVANTASFCSFTPQYEELVAVWQDYRDNGLVVVGVPSTDFRQEYAEDGKIRISASLPMASTSR